MTRLLSSFGTGNRYFNTLVTWISLLAFALHPTRSITYSLTQTGAKVVEDEMRKCFRYCALILDIVPKNNVVQGKVGCWTIREMTYDHTIYSVSILVTAIASFLFLVSYAYQADHDVHAKSLNLSLHLLDMPPRYP